MAYEVRFTKEAVKNVKKLSPKLREKLRAIVLRQVAENPQEGKRLVGDLAGFFSIRLTHRDRIVYTINEETKTVFTHRARTHYGE